MFLFQACTFYNYKKQCTLINIIILYCKYISFDLHTLHGIHYIFRAIIYLPLYLPYFFLCLRFKQKIGPRQPQLSAPAAADDDDDEDDASVPSSTPETAHPPPPPTASSSSTPAAATTLAAAVPFTSGVSKSSKKMGHSPGDLDIVQLLLQQQERSQAAAGELCQFVTEAAGPANNKSA